MKSKKILFILSITIIFFLSFINFVSYQKELKNLNNNREYSYEACEKYYQSEDKNELQEKFCQDINLEKEEYNNCKNNSKSDNCKKIIREYENFGFTTENYFYNLLNNDFMVIAPVFQIIIFLFISYEISKYFASSTFKNYLTRQPYNEYIRNIYKSGLKYITLIPTFLLCTLIFSIILSKDFNINFVLSTNFLFLYFIIIVLQSITYVNITMLSSLGSKNFIIAFTKSFLIYIVIVFIFGGIHLILRKINIFIEQINFFDLFHYSENVNIFPIMITSVFLFVISTIIIYIVYKRKEKVLICIEKSEGEYDN